MAEQERFEGGAGVAARMTLTAENVLNQFGGRPLIRGKREDQLPAFPNDPVKLPKAFEVIGDMLDDPTADHGVEVGVRVGEPGDVIELAERQVGVAVKDRSRACARVAAVEFDAIPEDPPEHARVEGMVASPVEDPRSFDVGEVSEDRPEMSPDHAQIVAVCAKVRVLQLGELSHEKIVHLWKQDRGGELRRHGCVRFAIH